jgi:FlaA1/EpsC-like NDP-sugar epimerase
MHARLFVIRNRYFVVGDLILTAVAVVLGFAIRLDVPLFWTYLRVCGIFGLMALLVKIPVYHSFGLYRRYWRYASVREMLSILVATTTASAILAILVLALFLPLGWFTSFPRSVLIIDWLLSMFFIGGIRFSLRFLGEFGSQRTSSRTAQENGKPRRVLIMGAGDAGAMVVREMQANPGLGFIPVGLLDDNRHKVGMTIHGVQVQGSREDIPALVRQQQIDEVLIAMPTAAGRTIREVVTICQQAGTSYRTIPGIYELISGQVSVKQVREVRIEDLLRRTPVQIDDSEAAQLLSGAVVLVTGAGGSIGSELCRQVARYRPKELLLLGHGEYSIHRILGELGKMFPSLSTRPLIVDIRDGRRLQAILEAYRPSIVFHTAAHKHVPLMEANVTEAVQNNIFGTLTVLQSAEANGVNCFVLVSSDKAVNPTNIMGATKRVAELLVQDAARRTGRAYVAVRFGNVLGSRGSVVPLFQQQIAAREPVTVTHPEMRRYFMTIPEAVQLIIQAAAVGRGGEILVLDMGEPVRIVDLATELIRLSGLEAGRDVAITFTGMRPGEKLSEVLFREDEEPRPTDHPKILVASSNRTGEHNGLFCHLEELRTLVAEADPAQIYAKMQAILPEYHPQVNGQRDGS